MLLTALDNEKGPARDIVALNAGASIYVAGIAPSLADGVKTAFEKIESGAARRKLDEFVACTRDPNTIVRYKHRGTKTVDPPFRRCEAKPYPGIDKQAVRVIEEAYGDRLHDAPEQGVPAIRVPEYAD